MDETNVTPVFVDVSKESSEDVRKLMLEYWEGLSGDTTESGTSLEIMLGEVEHSCSTQISKLEKAEMFSLLPDMTNMKVLEFSSWPWYSVNALIKH